MSNVCLMNYFDNKLIFLIKIKQFITVNLQDMLGDGIFFRIRNQLSPTL